MVHANAASGSVVRSKEMQEGVPRGMFQAVYLRDPSSDQLSLRSRMALATEVVPRTWYLEHRISNLKGVHRGMAPMSSDKRVAALYGTLKDRWLGGQRSLFAAQALRLW